MSTTIDGIPFMSGEDDNLLFGSLFPKGILPPSFNNSLKGMQGALSKRISNASPLTDVYFSKRSSEDIYNLYFPYAKVETKSNTTIIKDVDCNCPSDIYKPFLDFGYDDNNTGYYGDSDKDKYAFTIQLFISKDKFKLEECFTCLEPGDTDIFLFLEDNTGDVSSAYRSAKIGNKVKDSIRPNDTLPNKNNVDYINSKLPKSSQLTSSELSQLIDKGYIDHPSLSIASTLLFFMSRSSPLLAKGFKEIADSIEGITKYIDLHLKFKSYHWNPKAKKTKIEKDKEGNESEVEDDDRDYKFNPILFPGLPSNIDNLKDEEINKIVQIGFANLEKNFAAIDRQIIHLFTKDIGVIVKNNRLEIDLVPDAFEKMLLEKYLNARNIIQFAFDKLEQFDLSDIIKKGINILNAFLCGVWNGLVEAVNGLISLVGLIFRALEKFNDLRSNLKVELPNLLEQFDSFTQAIRDIDFATIFNKLIENIKNLSLSSFQPEVLAYFVGAIGGTVLGLVVEIVIGIVFTGGTLSVAIILEKLTELFVSLSRIATSIAKGAQKVAFKTIDTFKSGILQLTRFLQQGTEYILKLIDDFFAWLKKVADDAKRVINNISELLKIAKAANLYKFYNAYDLTRIINQAKKLNLTIEDFEGFIKTGNIKKIKPKDLIEQMDNYINIVLKRGFPFGFNNLKEFTRFGEELKNSFKNIGVSTSDIRIQGSSLRKKIPKDLDLAVFIEDKSFNQYLLDAFKDKVKIGDEVIDIAKLSDGDLLKLSDEILNSSNTNSVSKTFAFAMKNRKISALTKQPRIIKGHREIISNFESKFSNLNIEDISIQTKGGKLNLKPDLNIK